mmetsp:Transcript_1735/g.3897  ORF Transcript_1735/g.3897 Transcript_1735/m.3897 type:complete len:383 (+) Transcript_1735:563-1711(+)
MRSSGASIPVKALNCSAACPTNISTPLTASFPLSSAWLKSLVLSGLYTASNTRSNLSTTWAVTGDSCVFGLIPTEVVLIKTSPSVFPSSKSVKLVALVAPPSSAASFCALPRVRFAMVTEAALRSMAPKARALAVPPDPKTTTRFPLRGNSGSALPPVDGCAASLRSMADMAATQSVLHALTAPSPSFLTSVFTAPIRVATGSTSEHSLRTVSLWGMVTLHPERPKCFSENTKSSTSSTRKGRYTASTPFSLNAALWINGLMLCLIGLPITPNTFVPPFCPRRLYVWSMSTKVGCPGADAFPLSSAPNVRNPPYLGARRRLGSPISPIASAMTGPGVSSMSCNILKASEVVLAVLAIFTTSAPLSSIPVARSLRSSELGVFL